MNYIALSEYKKGWIFRHQELLISDEDLLKIKPMTPDRSDEVWCNLVSTQSTQPDHFGAGDWAANKKTWQHQERWQEAWDADSNALPEVIAGNIDWDDNTVVYFCYDSEQVIETTWEVFCRNWKNFLFYDDGPLLLGRKRRQVAQFLQTGNVKVGERKV